jgi:iron complex transport system substrate-binding protein
MARHLRSALALLLLAGLFLTACGDDDEPEPAASGTNTAASAQAFPVTIEHKYGSTEITQAPKRVVTVGLNEQDAFFALGVAPVAVTDWMGFKNGVGPWAEQAAAGAKPELLTNTDGIQFEKIAALQPDVIVALYSDLKKADYDKLSQIAPVVAPPAGHADFGIPWQETTRTVGKIVGKPEEAEKLVTDLEARIAKERKDHPEFEGKVASMAMSYQGIWVYGPDDPRSRLLTDLGFTLPPALEDIGGDDFGGNLAEEKLDLLDVGTLVWFAGPEAAEKIKRNRVYARLKVRREGRDVFLAEKGELYEATSFISVLSIPVLVDQLMPRLAAAADGDPKTPTD